MVMNESAGFMTTNWRVIILHVRRYSPSMGMAGRQQVPCTHEGCTLSPLRAVATASAPPANLYKSATKL